MAAPRYIWYTYKLRDEDLEAWQLNNPTYVVEAVYPVQEKSTVSKFIVIYKVLTKTEDQDMMYLSLIGGDRLVMLVLEGIRLLLNTIGGILRRIYLTTLIKQAILEHERREK